MEPKDQPEGLRLRREHYTDQPSSSSSKEYIIFVGPERTRFSIRAQIFNLYAPTFFYEVSTWPNLTPHAVKIVLKHVSDMYTGRAGLGVFDVETLRYCFDVYDVADEWGIQSIKNHVCQVLCASNILAKINDYGVFLAQLHQFYTNCAPYDQYAADAITKCLRTVSREHSGRAGAKRGTQRSKLQNEPTIIEEIQDILNTEFSRLNKDCSCDFCEDQRAYQEGRGRARFTNFRVARADFIHEATNIWRVSLAPMKVFWIYLLTGEALAVIASLLLIVGVRPVFDQTVWALIWYTIFLLLMFALTCLLAVGMATKYLFYEGRSFFRITERFIKRTTWKVVFQPISLVRQTFQASVWTIMDSFALLGLLLPLLVGFFLFKICWNYYRGNGPFDQLTLMIMKDDPRLAWTRIYHWYRGWTDPEITKTWVPKFAEYLEDFEKKREKLQRRMYTSV
ncbi:hypothetical protein TWF281_004741 [Arthrobotrys megalospora]